jgi:hypothetical protein
MVEQRLQRLGTILIIVRVENVTHPASRHKRLPYQLG